MQYLSLKYFSRTLRLAFFTLASGRSLHPAGTFSLKQRDASLIAFGCMARLMET